MTDSIYLTELEVEIMSVFVRNKVLDDTSVIETLENLIERIKRGKAA